MLSPEKNQSRKPAHPGSGSWWCWKYLWLEVDTQAAGAARDCALIFPLCIRKNVGNQVCLFKIKVFRKLIRSGICMIVILIVSKLCRQIACHLCISCYKLSEYNLSHQFAFSSVQSVQTDTRPADFAAYIAVNY